MTMVLGQLKPPSSWGKRRLQGWTEQQAQGPGLSALPPLELKSRMTRGAFPPKLFLSSSSKHLPLWEKHVPFVPKLRPCSLGLSIETTPACLHHCVALLNGFTEPKHADKLRVLLKPGDTTVPDGSESTALPPASYLLSFSNNTLLVWQLSRAV